MSEEGKTPPAQPEADGQKEAPATAEKQASVPTQPAPAQPAPAAKPAPQTQPAAAPAPPKSTAAEAEEALRAFEEAQREKAEQLKEQEEEAEEAIEQRRRPNMVRRFFTGFFQIRDAPSVWGKLIMAGLGLGVIFGIWFLASRPWWGPNGEERALDRMAMGSPEEVFSSFGSLWFERAFMRNLIASLWRVIQGFGLAILVGVPLGILCGTFKRIDAFFLPISIFGRNVPIAALVPLTMLFFGIDEGQKVAFIFISCVAFILFDSARAVSDVKDDYLDTAYTLGANRRQVMTKVLVPLAMPDIFNSLRLLLGLAFGYIILAEMVNAEFGVGKLILVSQRRGPKEHVYLILFSLTVVAFLINYFLVTIQKWLFAYRYRTR